MCPNLASRYFHALAATPAPELHAVLREAGLEPVAQIFLRSLEVMLELRFLTLRNSFPASFPPPARKSQTLLAYPKAWAQSSVKTAP